MRHSSGTILTASVVMAGVILAATSLARPGPAEAASAEAPYCIAYGGGGESGGIRTGRCEFFDYQKCLEAATGGANCVQNIDYHGGIPLTPRTSRRAR
jgi:hypothetical protein